MRRLQLAFFGALLIAPTRVAAGPHPPLARVVLVGDSTLASRSGYGDALCARFGPAAECVNLAKSGRSSRSYREEGSWSTLMERMPAPPSTTTHVLIQFGHEDQSGGDSASTLAEFAENLAGYVRDVQGAGAVPVLVTPLTRRRFEAGKLEQPLEPWAKATRQVAKTTGAALLDLHRQSVRAVQAPAPIPVFDDTHLGPGGADLFADIVARELRGSLPALARFLAPRPKAPAQLLPIELDVWRGAAPGGGAVTVKPAVIERSATPDVRDRALTGITRPTLTVYKPQKPDGSAVLILPGGAYQRVVIDKEGEEIARRLVAHGITAGVLLYRLPADGWAAGRDAPLQDAQRALRLLRSGVAGPIDPARIGVLGFSAGGDLAASLALRADGITYERTDQADRLSAPPDFSVLIYAALDMSVQAPDGRAPIVARAPITTFVTAWSPPCFIVHAADDTSVAVDPSLRLFAALKAANVPAEMHIFDAGGHGFGLRLAAGKPVEAWPDLLLRWGQHHRFFARASPARGEPRVTRP